MDLSAGSKLGDYEILALLGSGGMGEVYRTRDGRLGREVAIKILPQAFAGNPERVARFEREARILGSLSHPAIAVLHGLEEADGVLFFVMELVRGETLAERLARGPMPVDEALSRFRRIAEALEAAHEKGVVHRDLKPANIKLTPRSEVKLLDFGLARAWEEENPSGVGSDMPTRPGAATEAGRILGTAAYMSPEQARGSTVDRRTDVWAFGCCLYEALTGRSAFEGSSVADTLAHVVGAEPDWRALPPATPDAVRRLLRKCLQKDPDRRLRDIWDARLEIEEAMTAGDASAGGEPDRRGDRGRRWLYGTVPALVLLLAAGIWFQTRFGSRAPVPIASARYTLNLPPDTVLGTEFDLPALALSPDGLSLAFLGATNGRTRLYVRNLDELHSTALPGTEGAHGPFYSPDGRWLGFFAGGKLKKVSLAGGAPLVICDAPSGRGASWGTDDRIVFAPSYNSGLARVPAGGGDSEVLTHLNADEGENSHRWPEILPDGKRVLFTIRRSGSFHDSRIASLSLETGEIRPLIEGGTYPRYAPTGHLVYGRPGALLAVPFDPTRSVLAGQAQAAQPLREVAELPWATGGAQLAFSRNGLLVYIPAGEGAEERKIVWVDRQGRKSPLLERTGAYVGPRLSPDGSRLLVSALQNGRSAMYAYDLTRETFTRLSDQSGFAADWALDGRRVIFTSDREGVWNVFWISSDGSRPAERLTQSDYWHFPQSWSSAPERLAYVEVHPTTSYDIWFLSPLDERKPVPFLVTPFEERHAAFSPDGRLIAYTTNESGIAEVWVRSTSGTARWQISSDGGAEPLWSRDGRELFYRSGFKMMVVGIESEPDFRAEKPSVLFEGDYPAAPAGQGANYDVSHDGRRFVMIQEGPRELGSTQLSVVSNWFSELERLVPVER